MQIVKAFLGGFIKGLFINDPLTGDGQTDERIRNEAHAEYARVYFLFIALIIVGTAGQLFFPRHVVVFLPAVIGGGGSLLYFFIKYRREGLFSKHQTDERIAGYKAETKSRCFTFAFSVYVLGALPILFIDAPIQVGVICLATCYIPAAIAASRASKRGLYDPGSKAEAAKKQSELRKSVAPLAILVGITVALASRVFGGNAAYFDSILILAGVVLLDTVIYGGVFGVLYYFGIVRESKKKFYKESPEEDGDER